MSGKDGIKFSELFTDTVQCHGVAWAAKYYGSRGMECWEFLFWLRATGIAR